MAYLTRDDANRIWAEVKENHRKLDSCPGPHDLYPDEPHGPGSGGRLPDMRCRKCGGKLRRMEAIYYLKGVEHGRKLQGFTQ